MGRFLASGDQRGIGASRESAAAASFWRLGQPLRGADLHGEGVHAGGDDVQELALASRGVGTPGCEDPDRREEIDQDGEPHVCQCRFVGIVGEVSRFL